MKCIIGERIDPGLSNHIVGMRNEGGLEILQILYKKISQIIYSNKLCKLTSYLHTIALAYVSSINLSDPPQLL